MYFTLDELVLLTNCTDVALAQLSDPSRACPFFSQAQVLVCITKYNCYFHHPAVRWYHNLLPFSLAGLKTTVGSRSTPSSLVDFSKRSRAARTVKALEHRGTKQQHCSPNLDLAIHLRAFIWSLINSAPLSWAISSASVT